MHAKSFIEDHFTAGGSSDDDLRDQGTRRPPPNYDEYRRAV